VKKGRHRITREMLKGAKVSAIEMEKRQAEKKLERKRERKKKNVIFSPISSNKCLLQQMKIRLTRKGENCLLLRELCRLELRSLVHLSLYLSFSLSQLHTHSLFLSLTHSHYLSYKHSHNLMCYFPHSYTRIHLHFFKYL
jgi:hypothetical protein